MIEPVKIGDATLYLGDCLEVLPLIGKVDAVVTDPPYGLGEKLQGGKVKWHLHHGEMAWDAQIHPLVPSLPGLADTTIIWGGHLYPLPPARGWLIWDKLVRNFTSGHVEMAWTDIDQPIRAFNYAHAQLASEGKKHPTQKPLPLMEWCLGFIQGNVILDPFMGSGTTGVACAKLGRKFIGIEIEPKYFDLACERIQKTYDQPDMFIEPPVKPTQRQLPA